MSDAKFKRGDAVKAEDHEGYTWGEITVVSIPKFSSHDITYGINGTVRRYNEDAITLVCRAENREDAK